MPYTKYEEGSNHMREKNKARQLGATRAEGPCRLCKQEMECRKAKLSEGDSLWTILCVRMLQHTTFLSQCGQEDSCAHPTNQQQCKRCLHPRIQLQNRAGDLI